MAQEGVLCQSRIGEKRRRQSLTLNPPAIPAAASMNVCIITIDLGTEGRFWGCVLRWW